MEKNWKKEQVLQNSIKEDFNPSYFETQPSAV